MSLEMSWHTHAVVVENSQLWRHLTRGEVSSLAVTVDMMDASSLHCQWYYGWFGPAKKKKRKEKVKMSEFFNVQVTQPCSHSETHCQNVSMKVYISLITTS
jgi:hypothetical protein